MPSRTTALEERIEAVGRTATETASRTTALEDRIEAVGQTATETASRTTALEERIEAVGQTATDTASRTTALEERIEAVGRDARALMNRRISDLRRSSAADHDAMRHKFASDIDRTRSRVAVPDAQLVALEEFRASDGYALVYTAPEPLVSVIIATYNRARVLVERCLRSVVSQDYSNLEIIVVGDGCTDDTEQRVQDIGDRRIRFVELVDRTAPAAVARGSDAVSLGRALASGDLLTHLDDDDEYEPDRIGRLVRFLQDTKAEFVWHPFWSQESADAEWIVNEALSLKRGSVTYGAVLYLRWFECVRIDAWARRYREPSDWALFRTLRDIGVEARRYPVPLLRHYLERQNPRFVDGSDARHARTNAAALRRIMPLVPEVGSESEYQDSLGEVSPWLRAVRHVGAVAGIRTKGTLQLGTSGDFPTLTTDGGHVIRLYGPWRDGPTAFQRELHALQVSGRVPGNLVPRLQAHGSLTDEWSYVVTTEVPGVRLSKVRNELSPRDLQRLVRWLAGVVRSVQATPLTEQERAEGWTEFCAGVSQRHAVIRQELTDHSAIPPHLLAEITDWMPPLSDLLPSEEDVVVLHRDLRDDKVRGVWHAGRFDPTGLSDAGRMMIGHRYVELGALCGGVFNGDSTLMREFIQAVGWPDTDRSDFPKQALALILLDPVDHLSGLPALAVARDLDDLAAGLFGPRPLQNS